MASFTYRKLTTITTTLLLQPMILVLTAYVLAKSTYNACQSPYIVSTEVSFRISPDYSWAGSWNRLATGNNNYSYEFYRILNNSKSGTYRCYAILMKVNA